MVANAFYVFDADHSNRLNFDKAIEQSTHRKKIDDDRLESNRKNKIHLPFYHYLHREMYTKEKDLNHTQL